ncbi:MAG TPA: hypothetical protein VLU25_17380 [Acidobacteriota bacterium]|nr:hypothetical protein [Acidobacteriota bacterium]
MAVISLAALVGFARLIAARAPHREQGQEASYTDVILQEMSSPAHKALQSDPEYRQQLFSRYVPLLEQEMASLMSHRLSLRAMFWYGVFRFYFWLLTMRNLPRWTGLESEGIRILASSLASVRKGVHDNSR